jgi:hypothetical protein
MEEQVQVDETSNEQVAQEETTEIEEVEAQEEELLTIDDLLGLTEEDFAEFEEDAQHKGMKPLHEWLEHTPEEVRKHIANMRASYTRKTQELAEMKKQLEEQAAALREQQELALNNPILSQAEQYITDDEHDIYSEDGMRAEIKKQAALMLQEMLKPAQEKVQLEKRQVELQQFKTAHPEITDDEYRYPIYELMKEREELRLEDAYWIVRGRIDSEKAAKIRAEQEAAKKSRRSTLNKTSTGSSTAPKGTPKFRSAVEAYQWHKAQQDKK